MDKLKTFGDTLIHNSSEIPFYSGEIVGDKLEII